MYHKKLMALSTLLAFILLLSNCGSGSDESNSDNTEKDTTIIENPLTGYFVDSGVAGLKYICKPSDLNGTTDVNGTYTCESDDTVEFFLGKHSLGKVVASRYITPANLFPNNDEAALNFAQLIQTLDTDGDPSNGIVVDENILNLLGDSLDFTSNSFDEDVQIALGNDIVLITEDSALKHLNETLITLGITSGSGTQEPTPTPTPTVLPTDVPTDVPEPTPTVLPTDVPTPTLSYCEITQYTYLNENETYDFHLNAIYSDGTKEVKEADSWSTNDFLGYVSIDQNGILTVADIYGDYLIDVRATYQGKNCGITTTVKNVGAEVISSLHIAYYPSSAGVVADNSQYTLELMAVYPDNYARKVEADTWSVSSSLVSVSSSGILTVPDLQSEISFTLTATYSGYTQSMQLTVTP